MITVTTENAERTYRADKWYVSSEYALEISQGEHLVASYAPGSWESAHRPAADLGADDTDSGLGEAAYLAYCASVGWKSFTGDKLPLWRGQQERLREAWTRAAAAVRAAVESAATDTTGKE